jgi:signal transduction histidine kinase/CheY-like chemotaxis protein
MLAFANVRPKRLNGGIYATACICGLTGLAVLAGWTFNVPALKSVLPGFIAMQPWTAVSFILAACGLALAAASAPVARNASAVLALALAAIAGSPLLQSLTGATFGTDLWLFPSSVVSAQTHGISHPGRMPVSAAISLTFLAGALLLAPRARNAAPRAAFSTLATLPLVTGLAAFVNYYLRLEPLNTFLIGNSLALHSAFNLVLLGLGTLALRPDAGWVKIALRDGRAGWTTSLLVGLGALLLMFGTDAAIKAGLRSANVAVASRQFETVLSTLKDAETGQRGYLLTGKDAYLEPYEAARARLGNDLAAAQVALAAVDGQTASLSRVLTLTDDEVAELSEPIALHNDGRQADALALIETGRGKATMDAIRAEIGTLIEAITREGAIQSEHNWLIAKGAATGFAGLAVLGVVSLRMAKRKEQESKTSLAVSRARQQVLARSEVNLTTLLEQGTRDLAQTHEQLAHFQRMEALGQLAGGIAHDFNNVLQAVQGGAALIERRSADPNDVRRLARMVFEAAGRGASITGRLLAFSRRGDLRAKAVDPAALLADLQEVLRHTLGTGIEVRTDAPSGLPLLLADKGQLETVLINLATNARDAMESTGTLTLSAEVDILGQHNVAGFQGNLKAGSYIRLSVTDTGPGMTPDVLARVTEPFFTTKEQGKGTGLGLAMARGFADQSGGGLRIESTQGLGTMVRLWLPLADGISVAATSPAETAAFAAAPRRARLLMVDDDQFVREITAQGMETEGYAVLSAADGPAALAMLDAGEPVNLIICDLSMPGMDGLAVIREAQRRRQGLRAILLTGFVSNAAEIAVSGALSGSFSLLRKPATVSQLAERVAMLLETQRMGGNAPV